MSKPSEKRFVVKKYVMATSASEALKKEKNVRCDDVWIDDEWLKNNPRFEGQIIKPKEIKGFSPY